MTRYTAFFLSVLFQLNSECFAAGNAWVTSVPAQSSRPSVSHPSYLCLRGPGGGPSGLSEPDARGCLELSCPLLFPLPRDNPTGTFAREDSTSISSQFPKCVGFPFPPRWMGLASPGFWRPRGCAASLSVMCSVAGYTWSCCVDEGHRLGRQTKLRPNSLGLSFLLCEWGHLSCLRGTA